MEKYEARRLVQEWMLDGIMTLPESMNRKDVHMLLVELEEICKHVYRPAELSLRFQSEEEILNENS